jgi:hypothetical protein
MNDFKQKNGSMKFGGGGVRRMKEGVNTLAIKLKQGGFYYL